MTVASRSYLTDTSRHYRVSELVEAVQHFLFGIAIDEGFKGPQANTLAWDVLYPELMITLLQRMNHTESRNIVRTISYSLH
ncbi:hypothetical protein EMCRGX_G028827 [Ephydatia muelleri]